MSSFGDLKDLTYKVPSRPSDVDVKGFRLTARGVLSPVTFPSRMRVDRRESRRNSRICNGLGSAPRRTRTFDPLIKSLRGSAEIAGKAADSEAGAALGAAVGAELDARVARLIEAWPTLDDDRRRAVLAMLDGVVSMIDAGQPTGD